MRAGLEPGDRQGQELRLDGLRALRLEGLRFRVEALGFRVGRLRFRVEALGFRGGLRALRLEGLVCSGV